MPPFKPIKEKYCPCGCGNLCTPMYSQDGIRFKGYSHRAPHCPTSHKGRYGKNLTKGRKGSTNKRWLPDGSTRLHDSGHGKMYRIIKINGQWVFEHRHVMEQLLGRPLYTHEHVHHKRHEDTLNNSPDNLELLTNSAHATHHGTTRLSGWDAHPEGCLLCGTTTKKYSCKGLCTTCRSRTYHNENPEKTKQWEQTSFKRHKEAIYARNRAYHHRVRQPKRVQARLASQ